MRISDPTLSPATPGRLWLGAALWVAATAAQAQFTMVPAPATSGPPPASAATTDRAYRADGARHLYATYPTRIHRGKLPPLLYSVLVVETTIDAAGQVQHVNVLRRPAAPEVAPWVVAMTRRAAPFPVPAALPGGRVRYFEIWLVDKSGLFQVDTLTEGQL